MLGAYVIEGDGGFGVHSLTGEGGMVKSTANAKKWFQKASYRGHEGAKEILSKPPFA